MVTELGSVTIRAHVPAVFRDIPEGPAEGEAEGEAEGLAEGETLGETDADGDLLGEALGDADGEAEAGEGVIAYAHEPEAALFCDQVKAPVPPAPIFITLA